VPVEVAPRVDRADDRVQRYRLQAKVPLAAHAERADDLIKPQEAVAVMGLAAQAVRQRGQELVPPGPQELVLDVCAGESGI
jgi:peptidyl-tRNA hydrolase